MINGSCMHKLPGDWHVIVNNSNNLFIVSFLNYRLNGPMLRCHGYENPAFKKRLIPKKIF